MNCRNCGTNVIDENATCANCGTGPDGGASAPSQCDWQELLGTAAALGAVWLGGKILKSVFGGRAEATGSTGELPPEFQQSRSRRATEVPGEPSISGQLALQKLFEKRQHDATMAQMLMEHGRTMNKITLGLR